jgi:gamma-glutamylcyclotransferase (GGCT)/AIG2-like uncharacterized protein YtfP
MSGKPRPLFVYGTLCAFPLLAWVLTGEASRVDTLTGLLRKGTARGFKRCSLHHRDYPAAIKDENASIDGYLRLLETTSQRRKLDDFEGEAYRVTPVTVFLESDGETAGEKTEADIYIWNGEMDDISMEPWDLDAFIKDRLDDWIDLFEGMELVGDEDELTNNR